MIDSFTIKKDCFSVGSERETYKLRVKICKHHSMKYDIYQGSPFKMRNR